MRIRKQLVQQRKREATGRYLSLVHAAQDVRADVEDVLVLLRQSAKKQQTLSLSVEQVFALYLYIELLAARVDLLSLNLDKKAVRMLLALAIASGNPPEREEPPTAAESYDSGRGEGFSE